MTENQQNRNNRRRLLTATVVSDKMDKTRVVQVQKTGKHSKYEKAVRHFVKYKAHDEKNAAKAGDVVRIMETRPLSKDKRWVIQEIVESKA
jgi:small subunit ribosomal protein S17